MDTPETVEDAIEILQELGLREYEARCFVGLSRLSSATAKQLSEITEVPRTRVYDAIRMLEAQGLVEIHHSSPQRFRAVSIEEATETLRDQYKNRMERLHDALDTIEVVEADDDPAIQQIWSMSGRDAIRNRTNQLIEGATDEIVFVVGDESLLEESLVSSLNGLDTEIGLLVGALTTDLEAEIHETVPGATTFVSGLEWLHDETSATNQVAIGRLLLVDRSTILVSTVVPETGEEQAIFGDGFGNGLVVIARRLMAQGLLEARDPH